MANYYVDTDASSNGTGTSGSPWSTLANAISALQTTPITEASVIYCIGTVEDASRVTLTDTITGTTNKLTVEGNRTAQKTYDTTKYRLVSNAGTIIFLESKLIDIKKLQLRLYNTGTYYSAIQSSSVGTDNIHNVDDCILTGLNSARTTGAILVNNSSGSTTLNVSNTLIYGFSAGGSTIGICCSDTQSTVNVKNCTVCDFTTGIGISNVSGTLNVTNTAVFNTPNDFSGTITVTYSASDDNDVSGTGNKVIGTLTDIFTDPSNATYASRDFSLKNFTGTGCLVGAGTDTNMPTTDIVGATRTSVYDIGAFEYVAASTPTGNPYYYFLQQ